MSRSVKSALVALTSSAAALSLGACADYYGPRGGGVVYYDHGPVGFDGYYDDYYGPFYDGYWGDGGFYYSTGEGRGYQLDRGNHFRRDKVDGYHSIHGGVHAGDHGAVGARGAGERHVP